MRRAIYFGSFNPLHEGHKILMCYVATNCDIDALTVVVSPHKPFKDKTILSDAKERLEAVKKEVYKFNLTKNLGVGINHDIEVSDIEFKLSEPLYTYNTLEALGKQYPEDKLVLVVGADDFKELPTWHNGQEILKQYEIIVYPRPGYDVTEECKKYNATYLEDAPVSDFSSSQIRKNEGKPIAELCQNCAYYEENSDFPHLVGEEIGNCTKYHKPIFATAKFIKGGYSDKNHFCSNYASNCFVQISALCLICKFWSHPHRGDVLHPILDQSGECTAFKQSRAFCIMHLSYPICNEFKEK